MLGAVVTVRPTRALALGPNALSLPYDAVTEWSPIASVPIETLAWPPDKVPTPITVAPSESVTVPDGVPAVADTIAVNVTELPNLEGFGDAIRPVVVAAVPMVSVTAAPVLAAKLGLPSYAAVIVWTPAVSRLVESDASPFVSGAVPITVAPSENVTVPDGVPAPDETAAVNVTVPPGGDGFGLAESAVTVAAVPTVSITAALVLPA